MRMTYTVETPRPYEQPRLVMTPKEVDEVMAMMKQVGYSDPGTLVQVGFVFDRCARFEVPVRIER